jgi:hypothetical protein
MKKQFKIVAAPLFIVLIGTILTRKRVPTVGFIFRGTRPAPLSRRNLGEGHSSVRPRSYSCPTTTPMMTRSWGFGK